MRRAQAWSPQGRTGEGGWAVGDSSPRSAWCARSVGTPFGRISRWSTEEHPTLNVTGRLQPEWRQGVGKSTKKASKSKRRWKAQAQNRLPHISLRQREMLLLSLRLMLGVLQMSLPRTPWHVDSPNIRSYPQRDLGWMGPEVSSPPTSPHTQPLPKTSNIFFHK